MARVVRVLLFAAVIALVSACASSAQGGASPAAPRPVWVDSPQAAYPTALYIAAVGHGADRTLAERDALARIVALFGQAVQSELHVMASYSQAITGGAIQVSEDVRVQQAITTSAQMDTLVGAEIASVWHDSGNNIYYAVAIMERERTSILYAGLIRSNERIISELVTMTPQTRNSLDGFARYRLAAAVADANRLYANVLTVVGNTRGINPAEMRRGDEYRIAAAQVVSAIPVGIIVTGDRGNRIQNALSSAVNAAGLISGGTNSRYVLRFSYTMTQQDIPGQRHQFVRFELVGGLENAGAGNTVLFSPPAMTGREGHLTVSEAEERALRTVERRIAGEFGPALIAYLDSLVFISR
ncbi:MAG: LPP20 family lipoprotein [Treponema sp.]|nr:LPP20 family lipoprotein [Treponema sp.]